MLLFVPIAKLYKPWENLNLGGDDDDDNDFDDPPLEGKKKTSHVS